MKFTKVGLAIDCSSVGPLAIVRSHKSPLLVVVVVVDMLLDQSPGVGDEQHLVWGMFIERGTVVKETSQLRGNGSNVTPKS